MVSSSLNQNTDEIDKSVERLAAAAPIRSIACQRIHRGLQ